MSEKWEYLFAHVSRDTMMHTQTESENAEITLCGNKPFAEFAQIAGEYGWQLIDFHSSGNTMIPREDHDLIVFKRTKAE